MRKFLTRFLSLRISSSGWTPFTNHSRTYIVEKHQNASRCVATNVTKFALPASLTGLPIAALVPPGQCQFGPVWTAVPLLERIPVSASSSVLRFGLPNRQDPLQLSTCACILANAQIDGEDVTRPYTPISTNADMGTFDLLVKHYGPTAKMSRWMHEIEPNSTSIRFKHIDFNIKIQAPFDYEHIYMLVGGTGTPADCRNGSQGLVLLWCPIWSLTNFRFVPPPSTGITPMIQALHAILGASSNVSSTAPKTKVTMLYGSKLASDILGRELLDLWAASFPDQLQVIHVLSDEPIGSDWSGARGYINQALIEKYIDAPSSSLIIFVCGPPPMYTALCGPRQDKQVSGLLATLGYTADHVYKF
jgi:cytochrome-b5 reductase